jgi:hypothetical protein
MVNFTINENENCSHNFPTSSETQNHICKKNYKSLPPLTFGNGGSGPLLLLLRSHQMTSSSSSASILFTIRQPLTRISRFACDAAASAAELSLIASQAITMGSILSAEARLNMG